MPDRFVTLTGTVDGTGEFSLLSSFATDELGAPSGAAIPDQHGPSPFLVEVVTAEGHVLGRQILPVHTVCCLPETTDSRVLFATIPLADEAAVLRLSMDGRTLREIAAPVGRPTCRLLWAPPSQPIEERQIIRWEATHPEELPLQSVLLVSSDARGGWHALSAPIANQELAIDFTWLPGGKTRLKLIVSDGMNFSADVSPEFEVQSKGWWIEVLSPPPESRIPVGDTVTFRAQAYNIEERRVRGDLMWTSNRDGEIGRGVAVDATLSEGLHEITLAIPGIGDAAARSFSLNIAPMS